MMHCNNHTCNPLQKQPTVNRGTLSKGLYDVALFLGLKPEKTLFIHSTVVNDNKWSRKLFYKPSFSHSEILSFMTRSPEGPKGIVLHVNHALLNYLDQFGIAPKNHYYLIDQIPNRNQYPYFSVSGHLLNHLKENPEMISSLEGFHVVTSYLSEDDLKLVDLLSGRLLMSPEQQVPFNSKYYFRNLDSHYSFNMLPGVTFKGLSRLDLAMKQLKQILIDKKIPWQTAKIWCKFESQTSGNGSKCFTGFTSENVLALSEHILAFSDQLEMDFNYLTYDLPLVLELDVESLPNEVQVCNLGVEAVVGENSITFVGCVRQESRQGKYVGSLIDPYSETFTSIAEETAQPFLEAIHQEGYRGFMTIDVLLSKNLLSQEVTGYNIDPNARFTAGTPLLSLIHHSREMSGQNRYGLSYSNAVKNSPHLFNQILSYCGDHLYKGAQSNYCGIIPIILNDVTTMEGNKKYLRTVVIDETIEAASEKYDSFKSRILKDLSG